MGDFKNLMWAIGLSLLVLFVYERVYLDPEPQMPEDETAISEEQADPFDISPEEVEAVPTPSTGASTGQVTTGETTAANRIPIDSNRLLGSISTRGARIDSLILRDYYDELGDDADQIVLLRKKGQPKAYFAEFGWVTRQNVGINLPGPDTVWQVRGDKLTTETPVELFWDNGQGFTFRLIVSIDENYIFTIRQVVENNSNSNAAFAPFGLIKRFQTPDTLGFFILHEGPLGVFNDSLEEYDYDDLQDERRVEFSTNDGWLGFTDKYWLTALIPDQNQPFRARFVYGTPAGTDRYQSDCVAGELGIPPGGQGEYVSHFFAGAKEVDLIDKYEDQFNIPLFDRTIDWGWFYFLTKPIFYTLDYFYGVFGNFGVAILILTVLIKLVFFPLANKSYRAMSKMKKLQPKMKQIKERYPDDKMRQQQEIMAIYQKEKVNPAAGCLPILVQIPVFFALYKTLFVTIEMRHAPFFGWVQDLSAPDPLTFITLFGLVPWDAPDFLQIGIWPILMGVTMYLQQKLNPQSPDPIQQKIFTFMPIIFTFILARFPVGLVVYWTWNNLLSILQQWLIMRKMGVKASD